MSGIAVDIVLLPDEAMTDLAIAANAELVEESNCEIVLNNECCLPHISLAMGCIENEDVTRISEMLQPVAEIVPKRLEPAGIQKSMSVFGEIVSAFQITKAKQLRLLHETICGIVRPCCIPKVAEDMITGGRASESTLEWIRNYFVESAYDNFSPHITVGYGILDERSLPHDFGVSCIAICHLGNHCTCTKVLWSAEIS